MEAMHHDYLWMFEMMTLQEEENRIIEGLRRYPIGTDLKTPINEDTVQSLMKYNRNIYNLTYLNTTEWNSNIEVSFSISGSFILYYF